ncbi:MAG: glycosyltransferase family 4 protein [Thermoanaerobaculum sp.]|nr:glycosyltransferase family 4 protein [Thermoanaerobaculum sp.]MDW7966717.1 glycosyltransferase family 4 protein [Thermoanaerobaculum sp.]
MKLRVLHVITMLELGGAQRNTLDTVRLLNRQEFEVGLACGLGGELFAEGEQLPDTSFYPIAHLVREVRPLWDLRALAELRQTIRRFAPQIVHTHSSKAGVLGRLAAHWEGVPIIIHSVHGFGFGPHQWALVRGAFLAAERLVAPKTTAFVAVARENLEAGVELGLFSRQQAWVIRSGIDLQAFARGGDGVAVRQSLGIPPHDPVVLQISCFKPQKAPERFVHMAALVAAQVPSAHFLLVGDGELRPLVERWRQELGLAQRLHLLGWRRDVPSLLAASQVVTLTSRFEGLPRVLVEARAAGVPVVAMAVDGVVEVVQDGINGFTVPPGDVREMARKVAWLLANPGRAKAMGESGRQGLEEFSRERMVAEQEQLYRTLWHREGR